jgi:hypothetical protein
MVTLTNVGEGDAIIDSIALRDALGATTSEFSFGPLVRFPLRIPESGQTQVEICFRPTALRQRGGLTSFTYNSCTPIVVGSQLSGTGWARAGMRIDDGRVALPGSLATMPIHLDSTLAAYEVRTVTFQVRWNKSMLELRTIRPMPAAGSGSVMLAGPIRFEGREAVADFVATGDFLEPAGQLAELEFLVLRGDTLASQVSLGSLVFEDDNPKALVRNAGLVAFDSTCFRENKPVVLGAGAARLVHVDAAPIPATAGTPITVGLRADGESAVRVSLFSSGGGRVAGPFDVVVRTEERLPIATDGLPAGAYHVLVEEASGATHVRSVVVAE